MKYKDCCVSKISAITLSKRLYGATKYVVSTVRVYRDKKGADRFSVRHTIAAGNEKKMIEMEAIRVAGSIKVPFIKNIKHNMKVYDVLILSSLRA